ncbi:potassium transporter [Acuticoccus sediminis]|uniref:Potassium transporter n=1 Tax=Acuticoccus sediminis TaxID=2184697 RepID=A0A8B2ND38_9HYPH|nr:monovalent cation:proton antiporter-2 (CPA2) family protein [Acuticoccus sediminis]RAH96379.1 potassium transporter [Acuticoccus sediminis]
MTPDNASHTVVTGLNLVPVVSLLAVAVVAVPMFRRLGLGSVLGYLAVGLIIGPFGLKLFTDPQGIIHVAELGVVMFLFTIGLEMQPARLWSMRGDIFGVGLVQVAMATAVLTAAGLAIGLPPAVAAVGGAGFVLTSTAIVFQMLQERGLIARPVGRGIIAILLFEDLAIVPLLALVAFVAPSAGTVGLADRALAVLIGIGAIGALVAAGLWLLNPLFRLLAAARTPEIMTAAALLVVLGAAWAMQAGGLSMALGAFLAGVLLSGSVFRHQLEADIEPFRGILLGLFFVGVGMALNLQVVAAHWAFIALSVVVYIALKSLVVYSVARMFRVGHREALLRTVIMAQGGEFAFVLLTAAAGVGLISRDASAILSTTIISSMMLTPLCVTLYERLAPKPRVVMDGVEAANDLAGDVVVIGFGRFGHIATQPLLARGHSLSIIDSDVQMIRDAADFGFKVYYGDGSRLDILRAAGAANARAILICIDDEAAALRIAELVRDEFPLVPVLARAKHREHAFELIKAGVHFQIRDTLESAFALGEQALKTLCDPPAEVASTMAEVRRADCQRFEIQRLSGLYAGLELIHGNALPARNPSGQGTHPP